MRMSRISGSASMILRQSNRSRTQSKTIHCLQRSNSLDTSWTQNQNLLYWAMSHVQLLKRILVRIFYSWFRSLARLYILQCRKSETGFEWTVFYLLFYKKITIPVHIVLYFISLSTLKKSSQNLAKSHLLLPLRKNHYSMFFTLNKYSAFLQCKYS